MIRNVGGEPVDRRYRRLRIRLFLEGLVVLVSILIAFFLDGWREDRRQTRELVRELESVERELERNLDIVRGELIAVERILKAGEDLADRLGQAPNDSLVEVSDTLAWLGAAYSPTLDPSLGALDALINSGRLARIENEGLRVNLAGLRDVFVDVAEDDRMAKQFTTDHQMPEFRGVEFLTSLRRTSDEFIRAGQRVGQSPQEGQITLPVKTRGEIQYPNSAKARAILNWRLILYTSARSELLAVEQHLQSLMNLLLYELDTDSSG